MRLAEFIDKLDNTLLKGVLNIVDVNQLLIGVSLCSSKSKNPVIIGPEFKLYISPVLESLPDRMKLIDGTEVNSWDMVLVALMGAILRWRERIEFYIYAFVDAVRKTLHSNTPAYTAAVLDYIAYNYLKEKDFKTPFEEYLVDQLRYYANAPSPDIIPDYVMDIFGVSLDIPPWEFIGTNVNNVVMARVAPAHEALNNAIASTGRGAGFGSGGSEQEFVAQLTTPYTAPWIKKIQAIARAYANSDTREAVYSMDPADFTYWTPYKVIMADWRLDPTDKDEKRAVYFLVDTSGSVSDFELQLFINEIYSLTRRYTLMGEVVWFSGGVEGTIDLAELAKDYRVKIVGRGGTELAPALEYVRSKIEEAEFDKVAVVVLSDGGIADKDKVRALGRITDGLQLFFYTEEPVDFPGWEVVKFMGGEDE